MKAILYLFNLSVLMSLLACSGYSLNPSYNSKAKVLAHQQFDEEFVSVVKTGDKSYLVIGDKERLKFDGKNDTKSVLFKGKFKDQTVVHSRMVDGKVLVIALGNNEIALRYMDSDSCNKIEQKSIPMNDYYGLDDIKVSNNNKFTSLLILLPYVQRQNSEENKKKYYNSYLNIVFDNTLSIVSQNKITVEKDIFENDKSDFKNMIGHYVDNNGSAFLAAPVYNTDKWEIKILKIDRNNLSSKCISLPDKVANKTVTDTNIVPVFSLFYILNDGSMACATLINENKHDMIYMNIAKFDINSFKTITQNNFRLPEEESQKIYSQNNASVRYFPFLAENDNGDLMIFWDDLEEYHYRYRTSSVGSETVSTLSWMLDTKYFPISILSFSKDLNFKWIKSIARDVSKDISSVNGNNMLGLSTDNMIYCEPSKDAVFFVYNSYETNIPNAKDAMYCYRTINFDGELSAPEPLFQSSSWMCLAGSRIFRENDGSFSYFTYFRTTMGEAYDYLNVMIK